MKQLLKIGSKNSIIKTYFRFEKKNKQINEWFRIK